MSTASPLDLSAILEQARSGDTGAFAQIVRQYQSLVSGVLYNATGDFHKSEDIAQETFLIAWQKLGELREPQHLAAWLCTIARNLAHHSHRKPVISTEPLSDNLAGTPAPDTELLRREQSELVWSAIGEIDEKHRETLVLYYRSGQSVKEIADATESTEEAVRQRLVRARKSLKSKIEEMVGDILTATAPGEVFTATVMTALTATMLTTTAGCGTVGTAAGVSTTGGQALGTATIWSALGMAAFLSWCAVWIFGSFWAGVRNAPTLRSRRCQVHQVFWYFQYFWLFMVMSIWGVHGIMLATGYAYVTTYGFVPYVISIALVIGGVMMVVLPSQQKIRRIIKNDLGLPGRHEKSYTYSQVEQRFFSSVLTNVLWAFAVLTFFVGMTIYDGDIPFRHGTEERTIGVGLILRIDIEDGYAVVREVTRGGPADKSGELHPKDKILGIGQGKEGEIEEILNFEMSEVVNLIRGPKETVVRLNVLPGGKEPSKIVELIRDEFVFKSQYNVFFPQFSATLFFMAIAAVSMVFYYPLGRYFLETCRTKQSFLAAPPLIDKPFETLLKNASMSDNFMSAEKQTGKMYMGQVIYWVGYVVLVIIMFSFYSWDKHPILLGICVALLFPLLWGLSRMYKREKRQSDVALRNTLIMLGFPVFFLLLEYIELGGIYTFSAVAGKPTDFNSYGIHALTFSMVLMSVFLTPLYLFQWYMARREERNERADEQMLLREAIACYNPAAMTADEPEVLAKPFPRRWIWGIGLYAAALVAAWCVGVWAMT